MMLVLIDGYNVIAPIAAPGRSAIDTVASSYRGKDGRWLEAERQLLLDRLTRYLPAQVASQTVVIFDAASSPQGAVSGFEWQGIRVRFAVGYPEADDLIEELLQAHPHPKKLLVVSSDHRIQSAARRRGAAFIDSEPWLDQLMDGRAILDAGAVKRPNPDSDGSEPKPSAEGEVMQWLAEFGIASDEELNAVHRDTEHKQPMDGKPMDGKRAHPEFENPFPPGYGEDLL